MDNSDSKNAETDNVDSFDVILKEIARVMELPFSEKPNSQLQSQNQPKSPQNLMVLPPEIQASHSMRKPDSPKPRSGLIVKIKDVTPRKQKQCNCIHSRCLKLYCDCFASGIYCEGCNCKNCYNNFENEASRSEAVEVILVRNPNAFLPKIACSPRGTAESRDEIREVVVLGKHNKGCHCRKTGCLKNYCACFQANILCSEHCKCIDCKNFTGIEDLQAFISADSVRLKVLGKHKRGCHCEKTGCFNSNCECFQAHYVCCKNCKCIDCKNFQESEARLALVSANNVRMASIITGAIESSGYDACLSNSKKRKGSKLCFGTARKDPSLHRDAQSQQANNMVTSASTLCYPPVIPVDSSAAFSPSNFSSKSLLADVIQPQDMRDLCSALVVCSSEAAKTLAEKEIAQKQINDPLQTSLPSSNEDTLPHQNADTEFAGGESIYQGTPPDRLAGHGCSTSSHLPDDKPVSEVYAEQERIVLTKFRDCLKKIITLGEIKERSFASLSKSESGNEEHHSNNCQSGQGCQQQTVSNELVKSASLSKSESRNEEHHSNNCHSSRGRQQETVSNEVVALSAPKTPPVDTAVIHPRNDMLPKVPRFSENGKRKSHVDKETEEKKP